MLEISQTVNDSCGCWTNCGNELEPGISSVRSPACIIKTWAGRLNLKHELLPAECATSGPSLADCMPRTMQHKPFSLHTEHTPNEI